MDAPRLYIFNKNNSNNIYLKKIGKSLSLDKACLSDEDIYTILSDKRLAKVVKELC